jgi:hypothetical protein
VALAVLVFFLGRRIELLLVHVLNEKERIKRVPARPRSYIARALNSRPIATWCPVLDVT